jgi:peptide/nickel transport system substrate-binding protein
MLKIGKRTLVAALLATLATAGCSSSSDESDDAQVTSGEPVAGGTVQLIQMAEPTSLDPTALRNIASSHAVVGNALFGQLVVNGADDELEYKLAESLESADGGLNWVLTLRDGLKYSDGSPMTAEDVKINWERHLDETLGSRDAETAGYITSMSADGQELSFELEEPVANFPRSIMWGALNWIAQPAALEAGAEAFNENPVGAGPFKLESWTRSGPMKLVKNPEYYDQPKPYLDELVLTANTDENQRFNTVKSGAADVVISSSPAILNRGVADGLETLSAGLSGGVTMEINSRIAPFDDVRARQAVAKAIDLEAVNQAAYEGAAEVPTTLIRDTSPFFSGTPLISYDKAEAQELFSELADDGKPVEFSITAYDTTESRRVGEAMQAQLATYDDTDVQLEVLDFASAAAKLSDRSFQMMSGGVYFGDPEPELFLRFHGDSDANRSGIEDAELDEALETGRLSADPDERKDAYATAEERISELVPQIIYARQTHAVAYEPYIHGIELYGNTSTLVDGIWTSK